MTDPPTPLPLTPEFYDRADTMRTRTELNDRLAVEVDAATPEAVVDRLSDDLVTDIFGLAARNGLTDSTDWTTRK